MIDSIKKVTGEYYSIHFDDGGECEYHTVLPQTRLDRSIEKIIIRQVRDKVVGKRVVIDDVVSTGKLTIELLGCVVRDSCCMITARNLTRDTVMNFVYVFTKPSDSIALEMSNFVKDEGNMSISVYRGLISLCLKELEK